MKILFCGANDLSRVSGEFAEVVNGFGAKPMHFLDASIDYSNFQNWEVNSEKSVKNADVVVYVIVENYGEITWKTEYITAKNNGKPFIVMVLDETANLFFASKNENLKVKSSQAPASKTFDVLDTLLRENVTLVKFTYGKFKDRLQEHLCKLFEAAVEALTEKNKKSVLIELAKGRSFKKLKENIDQGGNKEYLVDILLDVFENKELRKRILDFFSDYKGLTDEQIIDLVSDGEQGVSRKTIKSLPKLIGHDNDVDVIFPAVIEAAEEAEDSGTTRRVILSLLEIDIEKAIPHLKALFPANDIGTPRRILKFIDSNFDAIANHPNFKKFENTLKELVNTAKGYTKDSGTLEQIADGIMLKWEKIKAK